MEVFLTLVIMYTVVVLPVIIFYFPIRNTLDSTSKALMYIPIFGLFAMILDLPFRGNYRKKHLKQKYFDKEGVFKGNKENYLKLLAKKEFKKHGEVGKTLSLIQKILISGQRKKSGSIENSLWRLKNVKTFLEEEYEDSVVSHLLISHQNLFFMLDREFVYREARGEEIENDVAKGFTTLLDVFIDEVEKRKKEMNVLGEGVRMERERKMREEKNKEIEKIKKELEEEMRFQSKVINKG